MRFASLTNRIAGASTDAWEIHNRATDRVNAGEDIIMLSIGEESDRVTSESVVATAVDALHGGRHHYTPAQGLPALRENIARYHHHMTRQSVQASQCTVHSGAQNALYALAQCLLEPGDEVILSEPYYTTYPATFTSSGASAISLAVTSENDFLPDPQTILNAITPSTRAIVLNSPSNPLGSIYSREQYEPILNACVEQDIWLINDEVYAGLLEPDQRFSPASLPGAEQVCITVSSLSKSHRMTGWRVGWTVAPLELAQHLTNLSLCMHYGLPAFIMDAATTALQDYDTAKEIRSSMRQRRKVLHELLQTGEKVSIYDSGSGMFVLLNVLETGLSAKEFASGLLNKHAVATLPCDGFGPSGKYLLRVGLCVDTGPLTEACKRINQYLTELT